MRYQDPAELDCEACGKRVKVSIRTLFRLEAECPECHISFKEEGLRMREDCDQLDTSFKALELIVEIEDKHAIEIPDSDIEEIRSWEELTINDLVEATHQRMPGSADESQAEAVVKSAIRSVFPSAPESLNCNVRLSEAFNPEKSYGDSYRDPDDSD